MAISHKDGGASHLCCSLQYCEPGKAWSVGKIYVKQCCDTLIEGTPEFSGVLWPILRDKSVMRKGTVFV